MLPENNHLPDDFQSNFDFKGKNLNHPEDTEVIKVKLKAVFPFMGGIHTEL